MTKPTLFLTGSHDAAPSFEALIALSRKLMGREPTPEEIAEAREEYDRPKAARAAEPA